MKRSKIHIFTSNRQRTTTIVILLAIVLVAAIIAYLNVRNRPHADSTGGDGTIVHFTDTSGNAIVNATIFLEPTSNEDITDGVGSSYTAQTDDQGNADFSGVPTEMYDVTAFDSSENSIDIGDTVPNQIAITSGQTTELVTDTPASTVNCTTDCSSPSPTPSPTTTPSQPAQIQSFTANNSNSATVTSGLANISVSASVGNVASVSLDHNLTLPSNGLNTTTHAYVGTVNTTANAIGLGANQSLTLTLTAVGLDGKTVTQTVQITFTQTAAKPPTPSLSATISDPADVALSWSLSNGSSFQSSDKVTIARTNPDGSTTTLTASGTDLVGTDALLTPNQSYSWKVKITRNGVDSDWSNSVTENLSFPQTGSPKGPTNFKAKNQNGITTLTWSQSGANPTGYILEQNGIPVALISGSSTSYNGAINYTSGATLTLFGYSGSSPSFNLTKSATTTAP